MPKPLPNESAEYTRLRGELLQAEIALKDQREKVAELRRALPEGPIVEDYVFREGARSLDDAKTTREVRLSQLFSQDRDALVLIQFMYGGAQKDPCPMCTLWADGYNAIARRVTQRADFAVIAQADVHAFRAWARERGWHNLRLLSSAGSSFKLDTGMGDAQGNQFPGVSVFVRGSDAAIRHFYTQSALMAEGHWRGVDLLSPVWHIFDLLPAGRGDWMPSN